MFQIPEFGTNWYLTGDDAYEALEYIELAIKILESENQNTEQD